MRPEVSISALLLIILKEKDLTTPRNEKPGDNA